MILGQNKKSQGEEQNWCVVLSPLRNELDRKKISQKISQVFLLSSEEAADLVANTPIILLDNLSQPVAIRVKEFFRSAGAELLLTNDIYFKRKCYRTVWPDPPDLSFLNRIAVRAEPEKESQELAPEEALEELRALSKNGGVGDLSPRQGSLIEELEERNKECRLLRDEIVKLREQAASSGAAVQKDKEAKELRLVLTQEREKYEALREEYREAQGLFDQKIAGAQEQEKRFREEREALAKRMDALSGELKQKEELAVKNEHELYRFQGEVQKSQEEVQRLSQESNRRIEQLRLEVERHESFNRDQARLLEDLEVRSREARHWKENYRDLEAKFNELQLRIEERSRTDQSIQRQLEMKDRELEMARKQLREAHAQLEQRDSIQKRSLLAGQLQDKEILLKKLVTEQSRFETEIKEREENMRKILSEQERVENEIIENKQAQRYLMEQAKREAPPRHKIFRPNDASSSSSQDLDHDPSPPS